jgi:hypothetical protein
MAIETTRPNTARELALLIKINELLPPNRQCDKYITKMEADLARLQQGPKLKLVRDKDADKGEVK